MTYQFEILELIANEELATLDRKTKSEVYRIFDKCVRIFDQTAQNKDVRLNIGGSSPVAMVCDKTFPIIATVLIENAIKYSIHRGEVSVFISIVNERKARIEVSNVTARKHSEMPDIFSKGVRGTDDNTGHGFGLHLAQLVARQHDTCVELLREPIDSSSEKFNFYFDLDIISKSK